MKHPRFSLFRLLLLTITVLAGLMLVAVTIAAAQTGPVTPAAAPGGIEGFLYEPGGTTPVGGGWIDIHDVGGQPWMGTPTAPNGYFAIPNLPPGEYILRAHPPPGSDFAASLPVAVQVSSGQWTAQDMFLTKVRISGWVQDSDTGARIGGASVVAHNPDWSVEQWAGTNITGEYKIGGVDIGVTYALEVFPPEGSEYVQLPIEYTAVPTATDVVLEMRIPPTNVVGVVHNPAGDPVPGAGVVVFHPDFWRETAANEFGEFLFRDLPLGEFWIQAAPPWGEHGQGLLSSPPFTITIPTSITLRNVGVITLPHANKTASGQVVVIGTTDPVKDAIVEAHRLDRPGFSDTPVNVNGAFTLSLPAGEWHLRAVPFPPPAPRAEWVFPEPPEWIAFQQPYSITEVISNVRLDVIPTNAWVEGKILCPGGTFADPCPGYPPGFHKRIWVELRHHEIVNGAGVDGGYHFEIPVPEGWYRLFVHVEHPLLQGPEPLEVYANPGWQDVGEIELWPKDATIKGTVRNQLGNGVQGVQVVGWQPDRFGWGWAKTDATGAYTMHVIPGEWFVEPHPVPDMDYVYIHRPRRVRVAPRGTQTGVDFNLTYAGARIRGAAIDAGDGHRLWGLDGWASAHLLLPSSEERFFSDAPMWDGGFELKAKGGYTYAVGLHLPPHAPYVSGGAGPIPVAPGELVTTTVPLEHKDAAIEGRLVISGTSNPPPGPVWAEVFGEDEAGHWAVVRVDENTKEYWMEVVSGTWHLRAWVDPASGYVAAPTPQTVSAVSGPTPATLNFNVVPIGSSIEGLVLDPDGAPMTMTIVFAEGESPFIGHFETMAETDASGNFHLPVPLGEYVVGAGMPIDELKARGWLPPLPIEGVRPPTTGLELRYVALDGEINGTIHFDTGINVTPTHPAFVWGWSENGATVETEAMTDTATTFTYTLPVVTGEVWHVGAVYEDSENGLYYESAEEVVSMSGSPFAQDLTLGGPYAMLQPFIVSFDGSQMQTIVMPDGVELGIPPGSLVTSGTVTLFIFPTHEMRPEPGHEIVGVGYEMWAVDQNGQEITQFNTNVQMTFHYPPDAVLEAHGIAEHLLVPVYYSTLVGRWILADSYVLDTVHNEIMLQISHFTKFGTASTGPGQYHIYLPVVLRNF